MRRIPLSRYGTGNRNLASWQSDIADLVKAAIRGEKIFIEFDGSTDSRRTGSIARLHLSDDCIQNFMHGTYHHHGWGYNRSTARQHITPDESKVQPHYAANIGIDGKAKWDGRTNKVDVSNGWSVSWLKDYDETKGTKWVWAKPDDPPAVMPKDKLGREIQKGDFISYILYHFDNDYNAAGLYYGKVTKIENDGTVWAKNIKLKEDDRVDEKRIKDNSLIVIMSKDLMDKLMLARLSIL